jgi:hypothetical protein
LDKLQILNRALGFIGEQPITNPDSPETPAGKRMANSLDACRRELLRRYPWNFAEIWTTIDKTTAPPYGYSDAYSMPADFLRLLVVGDFENSIRDYRMVNQGAPHYRRVICLNNSGAATVNFIYTADIELYSMWDPLALKVLAIWLAMDNAKGITGQDVLVKFLNDLLTDELRDAVSVDGQEQSMRTLQFSYVQDARNEAQIGGSDFTRVTGY